MSNQQNTRKSPYQSNRGTPTNQCEPSIRVPINQAVPNDPPSQIAPRAPQKDKPSAQSTPTKNRSASSTARQAQSNKQPTNSSVCVPRDKRLPSDRLTRDKQSSLFQPIVTSTPKSSQIREQPSTTLRVSLKASGTAQETTVPASCPPCPLTCPPTENTRQPQLVHSVSGEIQQIHPKSNELQQIHPVSSELQQVRPVSSQPPQEHPISRQQLQVHPLSNQPDKGREICMRPLPPGSVACVPRNLASLGLISDVCLPAERPPSPEQSMASCRSEGVKKERILKLEILSISGGTLYDVDKLHQQSLPRAPCKTEPTYDPCFDVDRIEALKPGKKVAEGVSVSSAAPLEDGKDRKPTQVDEEDEDTLLPRSSDDDSTLRDKSKSEASTIHDSTLTGAPAAPRKRMLTGGDDDYEVMRSAPFAPAPLRLSDLSLTDMPPVEEEREDESVPGMAFVEGPQLGLQDSYVAVGGVSIHSDVPTPDDVSIPGDASIPGLKSGIFDDADSKEQVRDGEVGTGEEESSKGREKVKDAKIGESRKDTEIGKADAMSDEGREADIKEHKDKDTDEKERRGEADTTEGKVGEDATKIGRDGGADVKEGNEADRKYGLSINKGGKGGKDETKTGKGGEADAKESYEADRKNVQLVGKGGKDKEGGNQVGEDREADAKGGYEANRKGVEPGGNVGGDEMQSKDGGVDAKGGVMSRSDTIKRETALTDGKDEAGRSDKSKVAGRTIPAEGVANEQAQADRISDESRGSVSLILGPSIRNFAHLALSPLTTLQTFLGPAPNARPSRKKRSQRLSNDAGHPEYVRMRSIRSAFVVTPYEAAATSLGYLLRRQNRKSARKPGSNESESSSEDECND